MAHSADEIQKSIKKYLLIGGILVVATFITVALSFVDFGSHTSNMVIGLAVATVKALLVALIFMHLSGERPLIYKVLTFTFLFLGVMIILFVMSHGDPLAFKFFESSSAATAHH